MRLPWRRRDLAERLRPYLPVREPIEPMVDADPIRMFLVRWMIETGDPIYLVAQGFGLSVDELQRALVHRQLSFCDFYRLATRLSLTEHELQGRSQLPSASLA